MSEWWTYGLSDFLLFSPRTYYRLFELYNAAIWPMQGVVLGFAGGLAFGLLTYRRLWSGRMIAAVFAIGWFWVAYAWFFMRYATINWAATWFAFGFAIEGLLLVLVGLIGNGLAPRSAPSWSLRCGVAILLFALFVQPVTGWLSGRSWSEVEIFGLTPDPTSVATLGLLLTAKGRMRWVLFPLPLLWSAITGATLWTMEAPDALLTPAVAGLALVLAILLD